MASLKVAEKILKRKLVIPEKPEEVDAAEQIPYHFNAEQEDDINDTLDAAKSAESAIFSRRSQVTTGSTNKNGVKIDHA